MGIRVSQMQDVPVIILKSVSPMDIPGDPEAIIQAIDRFRNAVDGHIYQIFDMSDADLLFSDMMITVAAGTVQTEGKDDPEVTTIFVGDNDTTEFGAQYMPTVAYPFRSQDEAINFVRKTKSS